MEKIDFIELATYSTNRYKESHSDNGVRYGGTLYVAIDEDNNVKCSKTPHILRNAVQCLLIHCKLELAVTNWYSWYNVEYINEEGCVLDSNLGNKFELYTLASGSYSNQMMRLTYNEMELYSCYTPWEDNIGKIWRLYCEVKDLESVNEIKLVASLFRKDETILELKKEIENFKFTEHLLEQERDQYKELLDEIKETHNIK